MVPQGAGTEIRGASRQALPTDLAQGSLDLSPYAEALGFAADANLAGGLAAAKRLLDARYLDQKRPAAATDGIPGIIWQPLSRSLTPNVGNLFEKPSLLIYYGTELRDLGIALSAARTLRWVADDDSIKFNTLVGKLAQGGTTPSNRALWASVQYQIDRGVGKGCLTQAESSLLEAPVGPVSGVLPRTLGAGAAAGVTLAQLGLAWREDGELVLAAGRFTGNLLRLRPSPYFRARLEEISSSDAPADLLLRRIFTRALAASSIRERYRPGASADAWAALIADIRDEFSPPRR